MTDEHTPLHFDFDSGDFSIYYFDTDGGAVFVTGDGASEEAKEYCAALIVTALNEHEQLKADLEKLREALDDVLLFHESFDDKFKPADDYARETDARTLLADIDKRYGK